MKNAILTLTAMLIAVFALAQGKKVPASAQKDFKTRFPNVTNAEWEVGKSGCEAEWKENDMEVAVVYDAQGKYRMTEREVAVSSLPKGAVHNLQLQYPGAEVMEAEHQSHANGTESYEVEFRHNGKVKERQIDREGSLLDLQDADGDGNPDEDDDDEEGEEEDDD